MTTSLRLINEMLFESETGGKMLSPVTIFLLLLLLASKRPPHEMVLGEAEEKGSPNSSFNFNLNFGEPDKSAQIRHHSLLVVHQSQTTGNFNRGSNPKQVGVEEENLSRPARLSKDFQGDLPPSLNNSSSNIGCDFGGRWLRVAVSQQPPLVSCLQDLYGDWLCNGSNVEVIQLLERKLNFRAEWVVLAQKPFALAPADSNSTSKGWWSSPALALVATGRAWMGANGLMRTRYRSDMVGVILSEAFDSFRFHFLLSKWVRDHDHIFIKPFSRETWLAILLSSLLIIPIFYLINSTSSYYRQQDHRYLRRLSLLACLHYRLRQFRRWLLRMLCCNYCCCSLIAYCFTCACCRRSKAKGDEEDFSDLDPSPDSTSINESGLEEPSRPKLREEGRPRHRREQKRKRRLRRQWRLERKRAKRVAKSKRRTGFFRLAYVAWYVAGSLANQGGEEEELPGANSCRILVAAWWLYLIVIVSFHSGVLTAILTFPKQIDFIQTLDDFLALQSAGGPSMRLWLDGHSELSHLLQSPDELFQSPLYELVEAVGGGGGPQDSYLNGNNNNKQGIRRVDFDRHRQRVLDDVMSGQAAYLEERSTIQLVITQEYFDLRPPKCHFKASRQPIDIVPMSLALSSRLPPVCITRINHLLKHIMRTGLAQKWRRKYEPQGNDCLQTMLINAGDVETIRLRHVILAFWLLAAGLLLGALLLILEVVWLFTADMDSSSSSSSSSSSTDDEFPPRSGFTPKGPLKVLSKSDSTFKRSKSSLSKSKSKMKTTKRKKRLQRTVELMNRLREGKIYSEFFAKVSGDVRARARRASQAIVSPFVGGAHERSLADTSLAIGAQQRQAAPIRRRRPNRGPRVAPMSLAD